MISENLRAAAMLTFAMLLFAMEDTLIKLLASELPFAEVLGMIGLFGFAWFWVLTRLRGERFWTRDPLYPAVALRNAAEAVASVGLVVAPALAELSATAAIIQAVPLFITLGAAHLRERARGMEALLGDHHRFPRRADCGPARARRLPANHADGGDCAIGLAARPDHTAHTRPNEFNASRGFRLSRRSDRIAADRTGA